jgi:hypothetical protein
VADERDWPAARWNLTAPESYLLQLPKPVLSSQTFRLALRELVLRGALEIEQPAEAGLLRRRKRTLLRAGTRYHAIPEHALTPILRLHADVPERRGYDGVVLEDLARAARRAFTRSLAGYVNDHAYPSLVGRGLMGEHADRGRWPRRGARYFRTPEGDEAAAELDEWLDIGRARVEEWSKTDPERALAYAGGAGAAILLMPDLYPQFDRIGRNADVGAHAYFGDFGQFGGFDSGVDFGGGGGGNGGGNGGGGG